MSGYCPPPYGGVVVFNYAVWAARYPELVPTVDADLAQSYFAEATLYLSNAPTSIVQDVGQRAVLLNMLVAHIASLYATVNGQAVSTLVGRIASAGQGSVNVSTDFGAQPGTAAWYNQTKYGASFDAAMAPYRNARPVRGRRYCGPYSGNYGWGRW
jgi:hypothetical protein